VVEVLAEAVHRDDHPVSVAAVAESDRRF